MCAAPSPDVDAVDGAAAGSKTGGAVEGGDATLTVARGGPLFAAGGGGTRSFLHATTSEIVTAAAAQRIREREYTSRAIGPCRRFTPHDAAFTAGEW